ncbi:hypothetical protein B5E53_16885 [Eubacterium sp. An11]|uniref:trypsin-like peptidase domain-containing protein n=1 Tax=Eubacterium sp. An11 TaxID=1965542 RepID=UPI000B395EB3|nr:trypsin-like peptidase domain-containing protein [Eubacterium sp. An11]OUQ62898.1 hypothetical protein B5E53_16885 [Eubacterium sp. An11]
MKRGRFKSRKYYFFKTILCVYLIFFCFLVGKKTVNAQDNLIEDAKQGVVEIFSGFTTNDNTFYKMKHASGFLISNEEDNTYVVTSYNDLKNSEKEKEQYCKTNDISVDGFSLQNSIKVIVKGDVTAEATIVTESKKENYAILQLDDSLNERIPLKLGVSHQTLIGDKIYTMGFSENTDDNVMFLPEDVQITEGTIQDTYANRNDATYLQHSALISVGNTGGPILNEKGYVIGINNINLNENDKNAFFSLSIDEVREVLDNFKIPYESMETDMAWNDFYAIVEKSRKLLEDKSYKNQSKTELRQTLQEAEVLLDSDTATPVDITSMTEKLKQAGAELQLKIKSTKKIMIILLIVIILLLVWIIKFLYINNQRNKSIKKITDIKGNDYKTQSNKKEFLREDGTTIFNGDINNRILKVPKASIFCVRTGKFINICQSEINIGKKLEGNDFVISGNNAVSRKHAKIVKRTDGYYLTDLDSANGTYLNGMLVNVDEYVKLNDKDVILLADEKIIFKIDN